MPELNPKQILKTLDELEAASDKLCELLPESLLLKTRDTKAVIALSGLRQISFDIDHGLILNSGAILKLKEMLDEQESTRWKYDTEMKGHTILKLSKEEISGGG